MPAVQPISTTPIFRYAGSPLLCAVAFWCLACGSSDGGGTSSSSSVGQSAEIPGQTDVVSSLTQMEQGDILLLNFSNGKASLSLSDAPAGAEYTMIVQSTITSGSTSTFSLGDVSATTSGSKGLQGAIDPDNAEGPQEGLERLLRGAEEAFAESAQPAASYPSVGKTIAPAISVGGIETFRVLSSLSSISAYNTVTATAKCVNSRIALYVDTVVDTTLLGVMSQSDYDTLCKRFAESLATEFSILGDPPDINGDGVIVILMTPKINALGASGGGIVTGFFFAGDLLACSSSNPACNAREIVYVLSPDPNGTFGTALSKDFTMNNLLPAVVPHEVQHLLSYNSHVLVNGGSTETTWLNEGLSHLIEDVVGYGQENPSRVALYLQSPNSSPLIPASSPNLYERGGIYLFLRFLYEQSSDPNGFLKTMVQSNQTGMNNIVAAYGGGNSSFDTFAEFMLRWGVAMATTNASVTTDRRYTYKNRTQHATTGHWEGVCLICDAEDGRNTTLAGPRKGTYVAGQSTSLRGSSNSYIKFSGTPSTVQVEGNNDAGLQGILLRTK